MFQLQLPLAKTKRFLKRPFILVEKETQYVIKDQRKKTVCSIIKPQMYFGFDDAATKKRRKARLKVLREDQLTIAKFVLEQLNKQS